MTTTTTPDAALLWARERATAEFNSNMTLSVMHGEWDDSPEIQDRAEAFRAGQAHERRDDAGLLAALEEIDRRCAAWASSSPNRTLVGAKPGTIRNVGAIARAAINAAKGADHAE